MLNVSVVAARKVAANLIAANFEEIPSEVQVFVNITADAYTSDELVKMEIWILAALELRLVFRVVEMVIGTSTVA